MWLLHLENTKKKKMPKINRLQLTKLLHEHFLVKTKKSFFFLNSSDINDHFIIVFDEIWTIWHGYKTKL